MRRHLYTAAAIVAALALAGCSATPSSPTHAAAKAPAATSTPAALKVGEPFKVKQTGGDASITINSVKYGPTDGSNLGTSAKNGGYLVLDVTWETADGTTKTNPLYFQVKDASGHAGDTDVFVPQMLGSGDVPKGDKSAGSVAFDVGPGPYTIIVTDEMLQEQARLTGITAQ